MTLPGTARLSTRRGLTLAEACVAIALTSLITVWATRLVFISDRAMQKDAGQIHRAVARMSLEAALRDDIQAAKEARVVRSGALRLAYPDGSVVTYGSSPQGTSRSAGEGKPRLFAGVRTTFKGTETKLVKATVLDAAGEKRQITLMPRNAIPEGAWDASVPRYGGGGGDE